jgi:flagellar basal body rod protein FlgG
MDSTIQKRTPDFYGAESHSVQRNYAKPGSLKETGNPLDVAIPTEHQNAFFAVRKTDPFDPNVYYTRNGRLSLGPQDPANPESPTVLYMAGHQALDPNFQPIFVDAGAGELHISPDGQIKQGDDLVGELALFRLDASQDPNVAQDADLQKLTQLGDSLFKAPEGEDAFFPQQLKVGQAGVQRTVIQGMREQSNVNIFHELVDMMNATKGIQANQVALSKQVDSLSKLFQVVQR